MTVRPALVRRKEKVMAPTPRKGARLRSAAVVTAAVGALFAVNGATVAAAGAAAPAAVTVPSRPSYEQLALDTLDEVVKGDFTAVSARFEAALRRQASPQVLEKSWQTYQAEFGRYVSHGAPRQVALGAGTVVSVPLTMAERPGEFRVTFDEDGLLVGLYFLRVGVPVS
ncbi:DUF3887 domain-containing protein [Streptomyces sp. NPDC029216]|uniref:DUF3887 domain-containing protein n=1 Tax=Streptomyces sp. NPDC029216 TaxID=3154701 RepID=UPI0033DE945B